MSAPDELYPPAQYGGGWMLLALGVIALLIVAGWLLLHFTRPVRSVSTPEQLPLNAPPTADVLSMLRVEYDVRIGQIDAAYRAGTLSPRAANLELSRLVRAF